MYNQGDILLIPLPFSDLTSNKKRPVLVLSNDKYNAITDDLIVVAVTSNIENKYSEIKLTNNGMQAGSLKIDSCIRVDKIYTLSQDIVVKKFGRVKIEILNDVRLKLNQIIS
ncbi:type II toxin-antitoxin system PemK/MazF family toxin [Herbivorax sp. ANBcel31]|uniref:type II toxin-antitoxin system PemK/MazF family toxin n=1 Tax=Herbivorax sp. ANBcel31 TaxID=3069754 RepID=UPI0027B6B740|nr:type II toxin-antitoxin system PemK/MazF family toxin [Herbivorax sp. ANBcel31]MDQ2088221.1 type II toxin-antitoxin system PemK/MazF family toxin [Herbivorax sp. ANBcel31]